MILIDELIQELTDISSEWNVGDISTEERNLKIDLLVKQLDQFQLNFGHDSLQNLNPHIHNVFTSLLNKHKSKAVVNLTSLKQADDKRKYNRIARILIERKLYFPALHRTIYRSIKGYADRDGRYYVEEFQVFTLGSDDNE
ncbi:hypothetical protein [Priestia abyssalis]|uniref:hypothetical protein n=1 Tax=Priestia abyssalis TaxID=1221450 RepID=UPI00099554DC|nr:hypothetical protein [Priestia abyssalis]